MVQKDNTEQLLTAGQREPADVRRKAQETLRIEVVRDNVRFNDLKERWNLLAESSNATIFQTYEWLSLWWKHFQAENCSLWILVFRRGADVVAIAPFFLQAQQVAGFRVCRRLKLMGDAVPLRRFRGLYAEDGPSDYLDLIIAPGEAGGVAKELVGYLEEHKNYFDEINFTNLPEGSVLLTHVVSDLVEDGFRCSLVRSQPCPRLSLPSSIDTFLTGLSANVRRKFQNARTKYWQKPAYSVETVNSPAQLASVFEDLKSLHQQRWNRLGYLGSFADSRYEQFQKDISNLFFQKGWLWAKAANMAGVRVGIRFGYRFNGRYYDYLSGFEDRAPWGKSRPGYALLFSLIDDAIAQGARLVDFLRGDEGYKYDLTSEVSYNWRVRILPPSDEKKFLETVSAVLQGIENLLHRLARELRIVKLFLLEYGGNFVSSYLRFAVKRVGAKFQKTKGNAQSSAKASGNAVHNSVVEHTEETRPAVEKSQVDPPTVRGQHLKTRAQKGSEYQEAVDRHFESSAHYWENIYEDNGLDGHIYQLRKAVVLELVKWLQIRQGERVLEIGSGSGNTSTRLAGLGYQVEAIDTADAMIEMTQRRVEYEKVQERVHVSYGDAHDLKYDERRFALVVAIGVVPWLHDHTIALREIERVLSPGAYLVITSDNRWRLPYWFDPRMNPLLTNLRAFVNALLRRWHLRKPAGEAIPVSMFTTREFDALLESAGFQKTLGLTVGFGPFTIWGKQVVPTRIGKMFHKFFQELATQDIPFIRSAGAHYIVVAQKPQNLEKRNA